MAIYKAIDGTTAYHAGGRNGTFIDFTVGMIVPTGDKVGGAVRISIVGSKALARINDYGVNRHVRMTNMLMPEG